MGSTPTSSAFEVPFYCIVENCKLLNDEVKAQLNLELIRNHPLANKFAYWNIICDEVKEFYDHSLNNSFYRV